MESILNLFGFKILLSTHWASKHWNNPGLPINVRHYYYGKFRFHSNVFYE